MDTWTSGGRRERAEGERGSATVWTVAFMALLTTVAMVIAYVGMARVARHRAQSAADLSALEAARLALEGPDHACGAAAVLAVENGAVLDRCSIRDSIAEVEVSVPLALPGTSVRRVASRARAGPVAPATGGLESPITEPANEEPVDAEPPDESPQTKSP
ncbi:hypothetical protein Misp01_40720 [Microtetraspora sp. NBRC 13810]|uniref:Rv3654c family TadE-like protein n=1 Tax=Microtetraspora sp. NBRC 13810 TaxID=3030990 RepID=UPI002554FBB2|nr:Rv3654c family TadE-like protein [Microtetraspora sp. NBRC 13810]GLW08942.1 hypothetical protein Misp01_40720 [Microtetraspora sp. NBRC 13810]